MTESNNTGPETCKAPWIKCIYGRIALLCLVAAAIRYWLIFLSQYQSVITNHLEVSTPLNSWKRVKEGLYLNSIELNPYEGDVLHEPPTSMYFYSLIINSGIPTGFFFILFDIITAIMLFFATRYYMLEIYVEQDVNRGKYAKNTEDYLYTNIDLCRAPIYVAATFLFNPYSILNCVGYATTVFLNCFLSMFLFSLLSKKLYFSSLFLAICTTISFYSIILVVPMWLQFYKKFKNGTLKAALNMIFFSVNLIALFYLEHLLDHTGLFVENVYGFVLTVQDLKPNIGLFWYYFTEMFDHFRDLFIYSFQINATIFYLIPLSLKFRNDIFLLITALLYIITIFKSYPCVGDVGLVISLLPCYKHLFNYSQQQFLILVIYLVTFCLGPIVWHLWIYSNSANANFYFGVTLAFAVAQIFLVTDILFVYIKREFCLYFGKKRKIGKKEAILVLE